MARETKVGLLVGMGVILLIGIILSDHLSVVQQQKSADMSRFAPDAQKGIAAINPVELASDPTNLTVGQPAPAQRIEPIPQPGEKIAPPADPAAAPLPNPGPIAAIDNPPAPAVEKPLPVQPMAIHVVKHGDTLYQLARQYYKDGEKWTLIKDANTETIGSKGQLRDGSTLVIPKKPVPAALPEELKKTGLFEQPNPDTAHGATDGGVAVRLVEVESGETLMDIAKEQLGDGQRWKEILELNKDQIKRPQDLKVKMKLRLPAPAVETPAPTTASATEPTVNPKPLTSKPAAAAPKTYTVQPGDTLAIIAGKTLGSRNKWEQIFNANRRQLASPADLKIGQVLILPATPGR